MEPIFYLAPSLACTDEREAVLKSGKSKLHALSIAQLGVCLALDLCEHIDIYGIGWGDDPDGRMPRWLSTKKVCMHVMNVTPIPPKAIPTNVGP